MFLENRAFMPFEEDGKLWFFKEDYGLNRRYFPTTSSATIDSSRVVFPSGTQLTLSFFVPKDIYITKIYLEGLCQRPQSNYSVSIRNSTSGGAGSVIFTANGENFGSTRKLVSATSNILHNQDWNIYIQSNYVQLIVYNFYADIR